MAKKEERDGITHLEGHRIAVMSDIHSGYCAFRACYEDARRQGVDAFIFLGDYVSDLAEPASTMQLLYHICAEYPTVCLRGNRERYMLEHRENRVFTRGSRSGSLLYTYERLQPKDFLFFEGLSPCAVVEINGIPVEIAHARGDDDRFHLDKEDPRMQEVLGQMKYDYFLTGHSHKQYIHREGSKTVLNPGSVALPQNGSSLAQYALLEPANGTPVLRLRQVPYDIASVIRRQFDSGLVSYAPHWAVSILYDAITGRERTMALLERVSRRAVGTEEGLSDEALWHREAKRMGMRFTESGVLSDLTKIQKPIPPLTWCDSSDKTAPVITAEAHVRSAHSKSGELSLPKTAVLLYMSGLEYAKEAFPLELLTERFPRFLHSCPVYGFRDVCILDGGRGAPQAADTVETLKAYGVENIVAVGMAGGFSDLVAVGDLLLPSYAFSEEGTSLHYYEDRDGFRPCEALYQAAAAFFGEHKPLPVVSTDAVYRQTYRKEEIWRERGAVAVDMETSAVLSVSRYHRMRAVALLTVSDLHPMQEGDRKWEWKMTAEMRRERIVRAIEFALTLGRI